MKLSCGQVQARFTAGVASLAAVSSAPGVIITSRRILNSRSHFITKSPPKQESFQGRVFFILGSLFPDTTFSAG